MVSSIDKAAIGVTDTILGTAQSAAQVVNREAAEYTAER